MRAEDLTIAKIVSGLKAKEFSCREIVSLYLENIKKRDHELHAYLEVFEKDAMDEAGAVDEKISDGTLDAPIMGAPIAVKDNILIRGKRTTAASKILEPYEAAYDATVISRLRSQGVVFLGKTNLDEFAMGSSTENSAFGSTKNPHDVWRVPGGSSGGSAAAVSAGLASAALGSDTGGSIRQPASFCGVVGLKPTYGAVSRYGLIAMASSLDQVGPITRTVEDAALLFDAISGKDRYDATTVAYQKEHFEKKDSLRDVTIGVPKEYFSEGLDADVGEIVRRAIGDFEKLGAHIREVSLPHARFALPAYYIVMPAEVSANLARFDGIRYGAHAVTGYHLPATSLYEGYTKTRAEGFGAEVKRRIMLGTYVLSAGYYDAYYGKAQKVRRLVTEDFKKVFGSVDFVVGPTAPTPAFRFGDKIANPLQMYLADIYTVAANLGGLPAISIPCGSAARDGKNLPVGLQLIGNWFGEAPLLSAAYVFEQSRQ